MTYHFGGGSVGVVLQYLSRIVTYCKNVICFCGFADANCKLGEMKCMLLAPAEIFVSCCVDVAHLHSHL